MKKQKQQFMVALAVLVVFAAAYFAVKYYAGKEQEKDSDTEAEITAARVDTDKIDAFSYMVNGDTYRYKKEKDQWVCETDTSIALDSDSISDMLENLKEVQAEEELTDYDDLSDYGLDEPQNQITVTIGEDTKTFSIGDYNEIMGEYYLRVDGDDKIYLIDSGLMDAFSKEPESLAEVESTEDELE